MAERESMEFDVVIVGGGPSGLAAAIRLRQLSLEAGREVSVCILEKGSEIGAHILSGAVIEPRALDELIPDWKDKGAPLTVPATEDRFVFLTERALIPLPPPPQMNPRGNFIVSLGNVCRWLAVQAEALGVEIFPGFAAAEVLYHDDGSVKGVATGDMGLNKDGTPGPNHQPGMELHAKQTLFAEGCRGSLTRQVMARFDLNRDCSPQTYGLGIKEIWEVDPAQSRPGSILHSIGWPLDMSTYGGSFLYHLDGHQVAVGFVVGLDYRNPHLSPYEEFQRFKTHPAIRPVLAGGRRVAYGARCLVEGGFQAIPKLTFPGGALIGDTAGFLNVPKIKGSHTAMKSGMVCAEAVFALLDGPEREATGYPESLKQSWLWEELRQVRNLRPAFAWGLLPGLAYAALETYLLKGRTPWTFAHHGDHTRLKPAQDCPAIAYPKPDGVVSFDRLSSVQLSNTAHDEAQPCHLKLTDPALALSVNRAIYGGPEEKYCPAGVYEFVPDGAGQRLQINFANCVHCKTCDIKDPRQNITWTTPQGGDGPNYPNM